MGCKVVFGSALARIGKPLVWKKINDSRWNAIDGNENIAYRITLAGDGSYHAEYTTPSIRLSAGPNASFLNLGLYESLDDAKMISKLHETCETIPVFSPGKIDGWVDRSGKVSLYSGGPKPNLSWLKTDFLWNLFFVMWSKIRSLISGK